MKAALPAYSEAIGEIFIFSKCSYPELCVAKKKKEETMFRDWVRGRAVPFCSLQPRGSVTKNKDETAHFDF